MQPIPPSNPSVAATHAWFHAEDVLAEAAAERLARIAGLSPRRVHRAPRIGAREAFVRFLDRVRLAAWRRQHMPVAAPQE
jgi:hypothetical protein